MTASNLAVQVQNAATLESKLKADRRNMALQRQVDSLKQSVQLSERALLASQVTHAKKLVFAQPHVCASTVSRCRSICWPVAGMSSEAYCWWTDGFAAVDHPSHSQLLHADCKKYVNCKAASPVKGMHPLPVVTDGQCRMVAFGFV